MFGAGDFAFAAAAYDWLVVDGPRATLAGSGTVNGTGSYDFLVSLVDGAVTGSGGIDRLRLKVWDAGHRRGRVRHPARERPTAPRRQQRSSPGPS